MLPEIPPGIKNTPACIAGGERQIVDPYTVQNLLSGTRKALEGIGYNASAPEVDHMCRLLEIEGMSMLQVWCCTIIVPYWLQVSDTAQY